MEMQNIRVSITPLLISYSSSKPITIMVKLKRILISTNYELQKFQCKKQFVLKNNIIDLAPYSNMLSFSFKMSKQFEINNTKIDLMLFGVFNKSINMLGVATLDLARYSSFLAHQKPIYNQVKILFDKSQDAKAYAIIGTLIQSIKPQQKNPTQSKNTQSQFNSIKTQSYNKDTLIIARRKKADTPSVYEISRKNYKQSEITRELQENSIQKGRRNSGSYKKRFQYQYNKSNIRVQREHQDIQHPQIAPRKSNFRQEEQTLPIPRMRTPQPLGDAGYSSRFKLSHQININSSERKKESPKKDNFSLRIKVDVYKQNNNAQQEIDYQEKDEEVINSINQKNHKQEQSNGNHFGKIAQQNINTQEVQNKKNVLNLRQKKLNNANAFHLYQDLNSDREHLHQIKKNNEKQNIDSSYNHHKELNKQSIQQQGAKNESIISGKTKQKQQNEVIQKNKYSKLAKPSQQNKQINQSIQNKYKMISDKLQLIENKIKQNKKQQSPQSIHKKDNNLSKNDGKDTTIQNNKTNNNLTEFTVRDQPRQDNNKSSKNTKIMQSQQADYVKNMQSQSFNENSPIKQALVNSFDINSISSNKFNSKKSVMNQPNQQQDHNYEQKNKTIAMQKNTNATNQAKKGQNYVNSKMLQSQVNRFQIPNKNQLQTKQQLRNTKQDINSVDQMNKWKIKNNQNKQTNNKNQGMLQNEQNGIKRTKYKNYKIFSEVQIKILPDSQKSRQQQKQLQKVKEKLQTNCKIIQEYQQKIQNLQNAIQAQEDNHRQQLMQKNLQLKNLTNSKQSQRNIAYKQQIQKLNEQNNRYKDKQKQLAVQIQKIKKQSQLNSINMNTSSQSQANKLKEQNKQLRQLVDKLHRELEESDDKHFQAMTIIQKKELEFKRKYEEVLNKNNELIDKMQKLQQEKKQINKNNFEVNNAPKQTQNKNTYNSLKNISSGSGEEVKSYQQEYLAEKQKCTNLSAQVRTKSNQISFMKIKIDNLIQQKRDLQNEIDNIAQNNKLALAKQGSISKMNLQSANITKSMRLQNQANKQQINNLRKQIHELNEIMNMVIVQKNSNNDIIVNMSSYQKQSLQNMQKKNEAMQQKLQAYQQQIKQKKLKITQILNMLFSHGNSKIIDEVTKIVGGGQ